MAVTRLLKLTMSRRTPTWLRYQRAASLLRRLTLRQKLIFVGAVVGVSSGLATFAFVRLIEFSWSMTLQRLPAALTFWRLFGLLALPAAGALMGALVVRFGAPDAEGHAVARVTEAIREKGGRIPGILALVELVASGLTIGFGGSAGREGPAIQIGGAMGSWLGQSFGIGDGDLRTLVAAGAAAGLGAAFGVPLAAVFFVMEVILTDFASEAFPAVVIAAVAGTATAGLLLGSGERTVPLTYATKGPGDLPFFVLVGVICGPCGAVYMRLVERVEHRFRSEHPGPRWLRPALGGMLAGLIGWALPEDLGTGAATISAALRGQVASWRAGALAAGKAAATAATLGTGGSGGAFMPAMFIGATAGSACQGLFRIIGRPFEKGELALTGLACAVTSAYRAPVTAIVMALEISRDYDLLMPVMVACVAAYLTTPRPSREPVLQQ